MRLSRLQRLILPILREQDQISIDQIAARLWSMGEDYDPRSIRLAIMRLEAQGVILRQRGRGRIPSRYEVKL